MSSSPKEREQALIKKYGLIEDAQERLQALCERPPRVAAVPEEDCREEILVRGCSSPVWLDGEVRAGCLHVRMTCRTPLVRSLAGIVCDLCDGALVEEVRDFAPSWPQQLGVWRFISEARQRGLAALSARLRELAGHKTQ